MIDGPFYKTLDSILKRKKAWLEFVDMNTEHIQYLGYATVSDSSSIMVQEFLSKNYKISQIKKVTQTEWKFLYNDNSTFITEWSVLKAILFKEFEKDLSEECLDTI